MTVRTTHGGGTRIDEALVCRLLRGQFPRWADLPVTEVAAAGTANAMFRLGRDESSTGVRRSQRGRRRCEPPDGTGRASGSTRISSRGICCSRRDGSAPSSTSAVWAWESRRST